MRAEAAEKWPGLSRTRKERREGEEEDGKKSPEEIFQRSLLPRLVGKSQRLTFPLFIGISCSLPATHALGLGRLPPLSLPLLRHRSKPHFLPQSPCFQSSPQFFAPSSSSPLLVLVLLGQAASGRLFEGFAPSDDNDELLPFPLSCFFIVDIPNFPMSFFEWVSASCSSKAFSISHLADQVHLASLPRGRERGAGRRFLHPREMSASSEEKKWVTSRSPSWDCPFSAWHTNTKEATEILVRRRPISPISTG